MKGSRVTIAVVLIGLVLAGFRGDTVRDVRGDYINDVRLTADGVVRFSKSTTGAAASAADTRAVSFLDVHNGTASELTVVLYTKSAPDHDSTTTYVPAGASRAYNGFQMDSLRVDGTWGGAAALFCGTN